MKGTDLEGSMRGLNQMADGSVQWYRVNSMSAVTARSFDSREARASPSSSSARTPAESPGPFSSEGRTRRVSQRCVRPKFFVFQGKKRITPKHTFFLLQEAHNVVR
jgi:hypothetical protein